MTLHKLSFLLGGIFAASAVTLFWLWGLEDEAGRLLMTRHLERALIQLALVSVIGGVVGFLFKLYQTDRQDYEKHREMDRQKHLAMIEFQTDEIRRLVEIANTIRRAPILIEAHRSGKTYGEQMRAAIDARLELHRIHHEVDLFGILDENSAFPAWPRIYESIQRMETYLKELEIEFREQYKKISELQRVAENNREKQVEVWEEIRRLPRIQDMLILNLDQERTRDNQFVNVFLASYRDALILMKKAVAQRQNLL